MNHVNCCHVATVILPVLKIILIRNLYLIGAKKWKTKAEVKRSARIQNCGKFKVKILAEMIKKPKNFVWGKIIEGHAF